MRLLDNTDDIEVFKLDISCLVSPIPGHAFFKQAQFEGLLGDDFFQPGSGV